MPRSTKDLMAHAEAMAEAFEAYEPQPGDSAKPIPPTMAVKLAAFRRSRAEAELAEAVRTARRQGTSWRDVGEALGTSGEAARQKYAEL
ncbi:hypothetical protein [Ruania alba]|uniref:Uncharacterized protein n=1 Tax=Ruania alba TaxID=648782 RepID=A0A1H5HFM6_9MICO|nr:hypothetical protein [Ruania alba]SEE26803.1 hypothetical protein SAMN04488554_1946 [Ruania alba]